MKLSESTKKECAVVSPRPRRYTAAESIKGPSIGDTLPSRKSELNLRKSQSLNLTDCHCCEQVTRKFEEFETELKQTKCDHAPTLKQRLMDQLQQVSVTPNPVPGRPRAGIVSSSDALKYKMVELSPGSHVFIHRDQQDAVIAAGRKPGGRDLNGEKMAAQLLHIFFPEELTSNNMEGPCDDIVQAVTAFCLARSSKSPGKVRASMYAELATMQES
ncbi:uncharacterized protein LOC117344970 [Pecten maximus]|uniref:uncharacterized protein LOC117344970 n=1 Tax=Pecten maximus TaxID=6579 RepID=UPI001457F380|nr:uncharacterized protein LOC117344970 [Pecten maximus]